MTELLAPLAPFHPYHLWERVTRVEDCHGWRSVYQCECGATLRTVGERHPNDPKWPEVYNEHCRRCKQLRDGKSRPRYRLETTTS